MKQLEVKDNKVKCPIDNSDIPVRLCNECSKCRTTKIGKDTQIVSCALDS